MIKNARVALVASLFLGGCFVDDPAMFDNCKTSADCSGTVVVTDCRTISVSYDSGVATESFCTESCSNYQGSCSTYSANGQLSYCAGQNASGTLSTVNAVSGVCLERCFDKNDCNFGYVCADSKFVGVAAGVYVCIPGQNVTIPPPVPYDYCEFNGNCGSAAPVCREVSQKWIDDSNTYIANICTTASCKADVDCPSFSIGSTNYPGRCAPPGLAGSTSICVQGCLIDSDCISGFACADSKDNPDIEDGYSICVPSP